ncbi:MAG: PfkB family carbohydrate kinase, partial [Proteobacteria bacterium]|nr:PfkB family carbohydrate kinase [Pseudomonadota bacterium]
MARVLSVGEIMLEMSDIGGGLYKKSFAGDTFNMAHYLNLVAGKEIQVDYLTALGSEAESNACVDFMRGLGVGTERCIRNPDRSIGLFILSNDMRGEKQYHYWRNQSAARYLFDEVQDLTGYDLVFLSGITAAITLNKDNLTGGVSTAREQGAMIAYDFNYRPQLWDPDSARAFAERILPLVSLAKISDEEQDILFPGQDISALSLSHAGVEWV